MGEVEKKVGYVHWEQILDARMRGLGLILEEVKNVEVKKLQQNEMSTSLSCPPSSSGPSPM